MSAAFELITTDGAARRGRLTLAHGTVETPGSGGLAECQTETDAWNRIDECLMDVFHCLDEMRLPQHEIDIIWFFDGDGVDLHGFLVGVRLPGYHPIVASFDGEAWACWSSDLTPGISREID